MYVEWCVEVAETTGANPLHLKMVRFEGVGICYDMDIFILRDSLYNYFLLFNYITTLFGRVIVTFLLIFMSFLDKIFSLATESPFECKGLKVRIVASIRVEGSSEQRVATVFEFKEHK